MEYFGTVFMILLRSGFIGRGIARNMSPVENFFNYER
jgi:hypothetical protein